MLLWIEGRKPRARRRGRPASALGPRSARVSRALLIAPEQHWTQKELTAFTRLPQPTVSRALGRLRGLGLVRQDEGEATYRVTSAGDLLDAWKMTTITTSRFIGGTVDANRVADAHGAVAEFLQAYERTLLRRNQAAPRP